MLGIHLLLQTIQYSRLFADLAPQTMRVDDQYDQSSQTKREYR